MRATTPKHTLCRRLGKPICGSPKCPALRRPYGPGEHGKESIRKKKSVYGLQLEEKQKIKYIYGITEKMLRNLFDKVVRKRGPTGEILLSTLESRLDNIVYRLGFTPTRSAARQLVSHRHVLVNGKTVNIASYYLKPKDEITINQKSKMLKNIIDNLKSIEEENLVPYIKVDKSKVKGTFLEFPKRAQIPEDIQEHLIVEYFAK